MADGGWKIHVFRSNCDSGVFAMATPTFARSLRKSPVSCNAIVSTGETLVFNLVRLCCFSSYSFYVIVLKNFAICVSSHHLSVAYKFLV